jgi:hypothetical protein
MFGTDRTLNPAVCAIGSTHCWFVALDLQNVCVFAAATLGAAKSATNPAKIMNSRPARIPNLLCPLYP